MDILFPDDLQETPTIEFHSIEGESWMALNASASVIPAEAKDYRARKADENRATGPTGVFLEMEWAIDMDWYDHDASWQPYIPLKSDDSIEGPLSESGLDWFFDFGMSTPWELGDTENFFFPERTRSLIETDLANWSWFIDEVTTNHPFPRNSPRPRPYDRDIVLTGFSSCEALQAAAGVAKRTAIDYLGFLAWWTSTISRWEADLDAHMANQIRDLHLDRFRKRGVLVDLERQWQEINIPNLLQHGVPTAYPWSPYLSMLPRFRRLSPHVLEAYDERRLSRGGDVLSTDFDDWTDDMAVIKQFDHFFQEIPGAGRPDPDVRFDEDWEYYVVDFQGWSRCRVPMSVAQEYYVLFASTVVRENRSTVALFRRWEPLDNIVGDLPRLVERTEDGIERYSFVREPCEIREMHKFKHAPLPGQRFDLDGRPVLSLSSDGSRADSSIRRDRLQDGVAPSAGRWLRLMVSNSAQRARSRPSDSDSASQTHSASQMSSSNRMRD